MFIYKNSFPPLFTATDILSLTLFIVASAFCAHKGTIDYPPAFPCDLICV